jgi:hypothetical protein
MFSFGARQTSKRMAGWSGPASKRSAARDRAGLGVEMLESRLVLSPLIGGSRSHQGLALSAGAAVDVPVYVYQQDLADYQTDHRNPLPVPGFADRLARIREAVQEINAQGLAIHLEDPQVLPTGGLGGAVLNGTTVLIRDMTQNEAFNALAETSPGGLQAAGTCQDGVPYFREVSHYDPTLLHVIRTDLFRNVQLFPSGTTTPISWYLGSDPNAALPQNTYDYETVVLHELGHALGLDHPSADPRSPMNTDTPTNRAGTLLTPKIRRHFTENDHEALQVLYPTYYLSDSQGSIYTVNPVTRQALHRGNVGMPMWDVAVDPSSGDLYGVDSASTLYHITEREDVGTGSWVLQSERVGDVLNYGQQVVVNSLDFGPDGTLYAAGQDNFYQVDLNSGQATVILTLQVQQDAFQGGGTTTYDSAGDLVFTNSATMFLTADDGSLLRINNPNPDASDAFVATSVGVVGNTGFQDLLGLIAPSDGFLYGFRNSDQSMYRIDPGSAEATLVGAINSDDGSMQGIFGASAYLRSFFAAPIASQDLVVQAFNDVLGRDPGTSDLGTLADMMDQGSLNNAQLATGLVNSPEYHADEVQSIYQQDLGRLADAGALASGSNFLAAGGTADQLQAAVLGSNEFAAGPGGGTSSGFLNALFQDVLHRPIDATSSNAWQAVLAQGASHTAVASAILGSQEADTLKAQNLYQDFLHRPADAAGQNAAVQALLHGASVEQLTTNLVASPEYAASAGGDANRGYVSRLYATLLHRSADAGSLTAWTSLLDSGAISRGQLTTALVASPEYQNLEVESLYEHYLHRAADPAALSSASDFLAGGGTVEQLAAALVGSPEYYSNQGGYDANFLHGLYQDVLGRAIDPTSLSQGLQALQQGATPAQLAAAVLGGTEYQHHLVETLYGTYLGQAPDSGSETAWANALAGGVRDEGLVAALTASADFFTQE